MHTKKSYYKPGDRVIIMGGEFGPFPDLSGRGELWVLPAIKHSVGVIVRHEELREYLFRVFERESRESPDVIDHLRAFLNYFRRPNRKKLFPIRIEKLGPIDEATRKLWASQEIPLVVGSIHLVSLESFQVISEEEYKKFLLQF